MAFGHWVSYQIANNSFHPTALGQYQDTVVTLKRQQLGTLTGRNEAMQRSVNFPFSFVV
jgi:hypothetical protein